MRKILLLAVISLLVSCKNAPEQKVYEPTWESLSTHEAAPEWFQDAKLGIYFHWGVYSVPAFQTEWYPRFMHFEGSPVYEHHLEKYGHPSEFGYHDFVPMFKAEKFDADEWVDLFVKAGAKFAGPVAEHHDGFSMWDSDATPWNAADMGPKRDITGELAVAIRERDMKLITTFHHAKQLQHFDSTIIDGRSMAFRKSHYPFFKGMPPASEDEKLKYLYGNIPEKQWLEEVWLAKLKEVIYQCQPDIIWFDSWLDQIPEEYRKEFSALYLNEAEKWGKDVVIVRKQDDLPLNYTVDDLEKSRKNQLESDPWMTDETISKGAWCYTKDIEVKASIDVLHVLIDIVSKNGVLLLNISPMADGTIPQVQQEVLLDMGSWLDQFGEAIYATRPWYTFGEGPTREPEGHFKNRKEFLKLKYSWKDTRYTTMEKIVYATLLGSPDKGTTIDLLAFAADSLPEPLEIKSVELLGSEAPLEWKLSDEGLNILIPETDKNEMAIVFKIETK